MEKYFVACTNSVFSQLCDVIKLIKDIHLRKSCKFSQNMHTFCILIEPFLAKLWLWTLIRHISIKRWENAFLFCDSCKNILKKIVFCWSFHVDWVFQIHVLKVQNWSFKRFQTFDHTLGHLMRRQVHSKLSS